MASENRLKIKFGLLNEATEQKALLWKEKTQQLIREGKPANEAGETAASLIFEDYRKAKYAAQADTIEVLLGLIGKK